MKFTWNVWDFDCGGEAFVIAKKVCELKENVPGFLVAVDNLHEDCKAEMIVEEGWCKWQVRTDWENHEGEPVGGYYVVESKFDAETRHSITGKRKQGWFPVWIVRKGEWY